MPIRRNQKRCPKTKKSKPDSRQRAKRHPLQQHSRFLRRLHRVQALPQHLVRQPILHTCNLISRRQFAVPCQLRQRQHLTKEIVACSKQRFGREQCAHYHGRQRWLNGTTADKGSLKAERAKDISNAKNPSEYMSEEASSTRIPVKGRQGELKMGTFRDMACRVPISKRFIIMRIPESPF